MSDRHSEDHETELDERASAWMDARDQRVEAGQPAGTPEDAELARRVAGFDALGAALAEVPPSPPGALDDAVTAALLAFDAGGEASDDDAAEVAAVTPLARSRRGRSNRALAAVAGLAAVALAVVGLSAVSDGDQGGSRDVAAVASEADAGSSAAELRAAVSTTMAALSDAPSGAVAASADTPLGAFPTLDALAASLATAAATPSPDLSTASDSAALPTTSAPNALEAQTVPASPQSTTTPPSTTTTPPPLTPDTRGQASADACSALGTPLGVADLAGQALRVIARADGSLAAYTLDCVTLVDQTAPATVR